jgi:hypothetical protein
METCTGALNYVDMDWKTTVSGHRQHFNELRPYGLLYANIILPLSIVREAYTTFQELAFCRIHLTGCNIPTITHNLC